MTRQNKSSKPAPSVPVTANGLPVGYPQLLEEIKRRISQSQIRAGLSVNRELIQLYWEIGRLIVQRQEREGWGTSVINRLADDIQTTFPAISGFSRTNISRMRKFYLAFAREVTNSAQPVPNLNLPGQDSARPVPNLQHPDGPSDSVALRPGDSQHAPHPVLDIPWGHNIVLLFKVHDPIQRLWYAQKTTEHGWSRAVLVHQIESDLYGRQGRAITNFEQTLPAPQSDLAQQLLKDPYTFDFLGLTDEVRERELENSLIDHIQRFLLELGKGFAFVGRQHHVEVGGEDFYLDLLFYHLHLRCFIVIDLKVEPFKPEFAGKMSFYLSAVDDLLRHTDGNPTIGLILCKERNRVVVEYTLRDSARPLGVATYRLLPDELKASLPSPEEFEAELRSLEGDEADEKTGDDPL